MTEINPEASALDRSASHVRAVMIEALEGIPPSEWLSLVAALTKWHGKRLRSSLRF